MPCLFLPLAQLVLASTRLDGQCDLLRIPRASPVSIYCEYMVSMFEAILLSPSSQVFSNIVLATLYEGFISSNSSSSSENKKTINVENTQEIIKQEGQQS